MHTLIAGAPTRRPAPCGLHGSSRVRGLAECDAHGARQKLARLVRRARETRRHRNAAQRAARRRVLGRRRRASRAVAGGSGAPHRRCGRARAVRAARARAAARAAAGRGDHGQRHNGCRGGRVARGHARRGGRRGRRLPRLRRLRPRAHGGRVGGDRGGARIRRGRGSLAQVRGGLRGRGRRGGGVLLRERARDARVRLGDGVQGTQSPAKLAGASAGAVCGRQAGAALPQPAPVRALHTLRLVLLASQARAHRVAGGRGRARGGVRFAKRRVRARAVVPVARARAAARTCLLLVIVRTLRRGTHRQSAD